MYKISRWLLLGVCAFMYCAGLFMITEGGMYVLQLVDNHSATYSALILGCCEVSVMAWIYGADRFLEDIKYMLGFYPYPRLFWKWAWKIISPVIVVVGKFPDSFEHFQLSVLVHSCFHLG